MSDSKLLDKAPGAYFEERRSAEVVNARMTGAGDARLREVMTVLVTHMHAAIKEARLTTDEWATGIKFLTDVGAKCTDWRQEFILLSDVLGVSMLVDAINHHRPLGSTENTVLGPFHVANAPQYASGASICLDGKGEPLVVCGRVLDQNGAPVAGAKIDVWQANDDGFYDVQQKEVQPASNLRGVFTSQHDGSFWFLTVKPRYYSIPDDGPVGVLLKALGRHPFRPAHLHFIVAAEGFDEVVTHIFTPDCPYLGEDAVFGVKRSLVADFRAVEEASEAGKFGVNAPFWIVDWDFRLAPASRV